MKFVPGWVLITAVILVPPAASMPGVTVCGPAGCVGSRDGSAAENGPSVLDWAEEQFWQTCLDLGYCHDEEDGNDH